LNLGWMGVEFLGESRDELGVILMCLGGKKGRKKGSGDRDRRDDGNRDEGMEI
jgi:hypothetical protein